MQTAEKLHAEDSAVAQLTVRPLTIRIGAEIEGIDVSRPIPEHQATELGRLLNKWKVLFFRNKSLTVEQHMDIARAFGPIDDSYYVKDGPNPYIQVIKSGHKNVDKWHTDTSWMVRPVKCGVLRAVTVPDVGGDTMWADGVSAYRTLPEEVKARIENLDAIHDATRISSYVQDPEERERRMKMNRETRKSHPLLAQPIVRTHPETNEKTLYLNDNLCTQIVGMGVDESRELLDSLIRHYAQPEHTCRFRWTPNAVAVWDQRQTMHYAVNDYELTTPREMHRIYVASSDVPHR